MAAERDELLREIVGKIVVRMDEILRSDFRNAMDVYSGYGGALDFCHEAIVGDGAPATPADVMRWARSFAKFDNEAADEIEARRLEIRKLLGCSEGAEVEAVQSLVDMAEIRVIFNMLAEVFDVELQRRGATP